MCGYLVGEEMLRNFMGKKMCDNGKIIFGTSRKFSGMKSQMDYIV